MVVPTRDRPASIVRLLDSILASSVKIDEIAIVSYGADLTEILNRYKDVLNLFYLRSNLPGQSIQKWQGIRLLSENLEWCIFTDDDLVFEPYAIEEALRSAARCGLNQALGVGFALSPTSRITEMSRPSRMLGRALSLFSNQPGQVLKSGQVISYLQHDSDLQTSWLNGASMWRYSETLNYAAQLPPTPYAAYEDVIFSYAVSKRGKLIFSKKASVRFQSDEITDYEDPRVFTAAAYFRLLLVQTNPELSTIRYLLSQFARSIYASAKSLHSPMRIPCYWQVFSIVTVQSFRPSQPYRLINKLSEPSIGVKTMFYKFF